MNHEDTAPGPGGENLARGKAARWGSPGPAAPWALPAHAMPTQVLSRRHRVHVVPRGSLSAIQPDAARSWRPCPVLCAQSEPNQCFTPPPTAAEVPSVSWGASQVSMGTRPELQVYGPISQLAPRASPCQDCPAPTWLCLFARSPGGSIKTL